MMRVVKIVANHNILRENYNNNKKIIIKDQKIKYSSSSLLLIEYLSSVAQRAGGADPEFKKARSRIFFLMVGSGSDISCRSDPDPVFLEGLIRIISIRIRNPAGG